MLRQHSLPDYPFTHSGTLIVVGSSPCVHQDLKDALKLGRNAAYAGVNEGAGVVPVEMIMSMHGEHMERFCALRNRLKGGPFTTHAVMGNKVSMQDFDKYPVDFWWDAFSGASSAAAAIMIGKHMGFDEIILCGCPLSGGDGYYLETYGSTPEMARVGFSTDQSGLIQSYQKTFANYAKTPTFVNVFSMSGFTKSVLGPPPHHRKRAHG